MWLAFVTVLVWGVLLDALRVYRLRRLKRRSGEDATAVKLKLTAVVKNSFVVIVIIMICGIVYVAAWVDALLGEFNAMLGAGVTGLALSTTSLLVRRLFLKTGTSYVL